MPVKIPSIHQLRLTPAEAETPPGLVDSSPLLLVFSGLIDFKAFCFSTGCIAGRGGGVIMRGLQGSDPACGKVQNDAENEDPQGVSQTS